MTDLLSWNPLDYPNHAGAKRVGPSAEAAAAVTPKLKDAHEQLLRAYEFRGAMTADEACKACGWEIWFGRPRNSELVAMGKLINTGLRRKSANGRSATVWDLP